MRTPILQKMIENKNLKICKTILIDECTSVGAALYGKFIKGNFPIKQIKNIRVFNYYKICGKFEEINKTFIVKMNVSESSYQPCYNYINKKQFEELNEITLSYYYFKKEIEENFN